MSFHTFDNVARREARRRERELHIARMEEIAASRVNLWDDEEPIAQANRSQERGMWAVAMVAMDNALNRRICIGLLCLATVFAAAAGFIFGFDVGEHDRPILPPDSPQNKPEARYESLLSSILDWDVTPRIVLEDNTTAPGRALHWLAYQDTDVRGPEIVRTRYALATLYFSTHDVETESGALLFWRDQSHWLSSYPVCMWHGVECHDEDTLERVKALNLTSNGLGGTLPSEIALLQLDVHSLDISDNSIEGTIPESLSRLKNLGKSHSCLVW